MFAHSEGWAVGKLGKSERASHSEYGVSTMIFGVCSDVSLGSGSRDGWYSAKL